MSKKKADAAENVRVLVRCRPLSEKEKNNGNTSCVDLDIAQHTVTVNPVVGNPDRFTFDATINNTFSQKDIFNQYIMPLVDSVLDGFNATVFAYGQSGSGKTHTMTGVMGDEEMEGVIPRCFKYIFDHVKETKEAEPNKVFSMYVSFVELYNGKVRDLLAAKQVTLDVRESKDKTFFVQGVNIPQVKFPEEIIRLMEEGTDRRRVAATELNADSSRSHSLFTLVIECSETLEDGSARSVTSKLNLVDLAGSERQGKTGASGDTLKEGCNINLSLSALGTVIDCIVKGAPHVPFRSSPLTMLLKDSLGGNSKTVMFANINPSANNVSETISTLRFADRAKQIKNKPVVNMDTKDQKIAELTEMVNELRTKLEKYSTGGTLGLEEEVEQLREKVGELEVNLDNAVKSREADLVDFENSKQQIIEERQTFNSRLVEMEEQVSQLQNDLQIAETNAKDAQSSLEEVLQLCAQYLNDKKPIATVDELSAILKDKSFGGNSAESSQLKTQVETLTVENKSLKKDYKALKKDMEQQLKNAKEEAQAAESKMKRMKKELQASHDAWEVEAESDAAADGGEAKEKEKKKPNPQKAIKALNDDYSRRQDELIAAMKVDDNGATAIKALKKENEELRQQLLAKPSAIAGAGDSTSGAEVEEIRKSLQDVQKERDGLYEQLSAAREEAAEAAKAAAEANGKINEVRGEYERKLATASSSAGEVDKLTAKLKDRNDQLEQMRTLLDKQKALIVKSNEKAEYYQQEVKEANKKTASTEERYRAMLDEKDAQFQKAVSERLEEYMTQRKEEEKDRNTIVKKLKKKITKMQDNIAELEQNFDMKVCECEELRELLSEQKLQQMKLVRRIDSTANNANTSADEELEVEETKEKIQNALERAKEERKRKSDMFAMGEVKNAKNK